MQPLYPGPLLTRDIVPKIPLYPLVYYLCLTIGLGVVTSIGGQIVNDIAASEDILGEIILYKTLSGNIIVYYIMSALYFYIILY